MDVFCDKFRSRICEKYVVHMKDYKREKSEPMTLDAIAKLPVFEGTRERVRQIEANALKKLRRSPSTMKLLKDFVA